MDGSNSRVYRNDYNSGRRISSGNYLNRQGQSGGYSSITGGAGVRRSSPVRTLEGGTYAGGTRYPQTGSYRGQTRPLGTSNTYQPSTYTGGNYRTGGTSSGYVRREGGSYSGFTQGNTIKSSTYNQGNAIKSSTYTQGNAINSSTYNQGNTIKSSTYNQGTATIQPASYTQGNTVKAADFNLKTTTGGVVRLTGDSVRTYPGGTNTAQTGIIANTAGLRPAFTTTINSTSMGGVLTSPYMDPEFNILVRFNPISNEVIDARTNEVVKSLTPRKGETYGYEDQEREDGENYEDQDQEGEEGGNCGDIGDYNPMEYEEIGDPEIENIVAVDNAYFQIVNHNLFRIFEKIDRLTQGNNVISPISIFMAFSILAEGVSGVSKQEVFEFFNFDPSEVIPPQELAYLLQLFNSSNESCQLLMANSAWINQNISVSDEYIDHINQKYVAKIESVNMKDPSTKDDINNWVEVQTGGMIPEILTLVEPTTMLMLINAVYFKGFWAEKFEPFVVDEENEDFDGMFHSSDEEQFEADFMKTNDKYPYLGTEEADYVVLPYKSTPVKMVLVLPKGGYDPYFGLDLEEVVQVTKVGSTCKVNLTMPKFKMRTRTNLRDILAGLGCSKIFDPNQNEDFKDIFEGEGYISKMIHEAVIEVDEEGTTAAGVTVVEFKTRSLEIVEEVKVLVNRPFSFFLVDSVSSLILFAGVYRKPE